MEDGKNGTRLIFKKLDFRPSNGLDIRLCMSGNKLYTIRAFTFGAEYTTSEPEAPAASRCKRLKITTVADFTRTILECFTYKRTGIYRLPHSIGLFCS